MEDSVKEAMLEYEQLKISIKAQEARLDELKDKIMPAVEEGKRYAAAEGTFEVVSKASWKFSDAVAALKEQVKASEADEIARGIATNNPTVYLKYTVNKQ